MPVSPSRRLILAGGLALLARPALADENAPPAGIEWQGEFAQGGLVRGRAASGLQLKLNGRPLPLGPQGEFIFGFGRDEPAKAEFSVAAADGKTRTISLSVAKRQWDIQKIDGLPPAQVTPPPALLERIKRENAAIAAVRERMTPRLDYLSGFAWPADGPISGVYGSQRILNGEARAPHYGLDIAAPKGAPVRASTDGEVVLAEPDIYFTGGTLIIDHGYGINSAYSHLSAIHVKVGQRVKQGEVIGAVGATGRVTGPHLDWRVNWFEVRIDPQRLLPKRD